MFKSFTKDLPAELRHLMAARVLLAFGIGLSFPFIPIYYQHRALSLDAVGLLLAISGLCGALGGLTGGRLADQMGAKRAMILSLRCRSGLTALVALMILSNASPYLLALVLFSNSFLGFMFHPACDTYVARRLGYAARTAAFSWMRVAINAGWALGPAVGGLLAGRVGYGALFMASAIMTLINSFFLEKALQEQVAPSARRDSLIDLETAAAPAALRISQDQFRSRFASTDSALKALLKVSENPFVRLFLAAAFLGSLVNGPLFAMLSLYLTRYRSEGEALIGLLFGWNGLLVVAFQIPMARRTRRFSLPAAGSIGLLFYGVGYLLLAAGRSWPDYFIGVTTATIGEMIYSPAYASLSANVGTFFGGNRRQGSMIGLTEFLVTLGAISSYAAGGFLLERFPGPAPWIIISAIAVAASGIYLRLARLAPAREILGLPSPIASP